MAESTRLIRDDAYEEMGAAYQCVQVEALDEALVSNGIADPDLRRKICASFAFSMRNFHDQCWFQATDAPLYPLLCFSTRFPDIDVSPDELGDVFVPSVSFAYHEYASGSVDGYFNGEPGYKVETGAVGDLEDE